MRSMLAALLAIFGCGCAADLGAGPGVELPTGNVVGLGRVSAQTRIADPLNTKGVLVGGHLETRAEDTQGSRFQAGAMVGWGTGPDPVSPWPIGFDVYAEAGTPIRDGFFRRGDFYAGPAVAFPIRTYISRGIREMNESTWVLRRQLEIVPLVRYRFYLDHPGFEPLTLRSELAATLSLRFRAFSDLF